MKNYWRCILIGCLIIFGAKSNGMDREISIVSKKDSITQSYEIIYSESYVVNSFAAQLYINKGIARMKEKNYELAIADFLHALRLNPGLFEAYTLLGEAMAAIDMTSEAIDAFDKAIDLNPFYAEAYYKRGHLLRLLGNYKQAYRDYTIAIYIDPLYASAFNSPKGDFSTLKNAFRHELKALRK